MNLFGAEVAGLDVEAFLTGARQLYPVAALLWLGLLLRIRRPWWLLLGIALANGWVWLETTWPLQRLYALGPSSDRLNNVAMVQPVAAGHSPLYTAQIGQLHFEPLWAALVAAASGFDTDRLLVVYGWLPFALSAAVAVSLYLALRPAPGEPGWSGWERCFVAGAATLLFSTPLDHVGTYRVPWTLTYLLKPNHALGLVLAPWVLRAVARAAGWRGRLLAGFVLHLVAWAFVIHMGALAIGLAATAAMAWLWRRDEARRDTLDVATAVGVNVLIASPYLFMLFRGFGVFDTGPAAEIAPRSAHILEVTTRSMGLTLLGAWGAVVAWRRDRIGRYWAGTLVGAAALWVSLYGLHVLQLAKERDDVFFWVRFVLAVCAGIGLWDLAGRLRGVLAAIGAAWAERVEPEPVRAAIVAALLVPASIPYWYDPRAMDGYFRPSLEPIDTELTTLVDALRAQGGRVDVVGGDPELTRWAAALGGFRVLWAHNFRMPDDIERRRRLVAEVLSGPAPGSVRELRQGYRVTHLIVTADLARELGVPGIDGVSSRPDLRVIRRIDEHTRRGGEIRRSILVLELPAS